MFCLDRGTTDFAVGKQQVFAVGFHRDVLAYGDTR